MLPTRAHSMFSETKAGRDSQTERWFRSTRNTQLYPPAVCQWWSPHPVCCSICQGGTRLSETQILPRPHFKSRAPSTDSSSRPRCLLLRFPPHTSLSSHQAMLAALTQGPEACIYSTRPVPLPPARLSSIPACYPISIRSPLPSRSHSPPALSPFKALSLSLLGLERGRSHSISPSVSQEPEIPARDAI
ncbi:Tripartite terminase subunit 1 [Dissostichus eleginoides]|uniref:Tripartite terminase subunit 1 n=1 Tax=Dissostichus eleginoides TaxID=100907 RepID=A0AAD9BMC4_DISEL|nr:Tripartite terminase subunit 1 [Dissostichus eleginoides]